MQRIDPQGPNAQQIKFWNEEAGPRWIRLHQDITAHIRPLGERVIARVPIAPSARVLDVGCGCGETTFYVARLVGPEGIAIGVDISAPMLHEAQERAKSMDILNVHFDHADAQTADLGEHLYDAMISRFGVMFFSDPVKAFQNIRRALKPRAPMGFICWRTVKENPWLSLVMQALAKHIALPVPDPHAPGPFAFADGERVRSLLATAGFEDVHVEAVDETLLLAGRVMGLEEAVDFMMQVGPGPALLKDVSDDIKETVRNSVREAVRPHLSEEGVRMKAAAWIVTAHAGEPG